MSYRIISPRVHAFLDYCVAAALVAAPLTLFPDAPTAAIAISIGAGLALLGYSLLTTYSTGARNAISFRAHLVLDFVAAMLMLAIPPLVGFSGTARIFYWIVGTAVIAVVVTTRVEEEEPESIAPTGSRLEHTP